MATKQSTATDEVPYGWSKRDWSRIQAGKIPNDEFAEKMYNGIANAPPLITKKQMYTMGQVYLDEGVHVRLALGIASKSGRFLRRKIATDRTAALLFAESALRIHSTAKRLHELAEIMNSVATRHDVLLCAREDIEAINAEAMQSIQQARSTKAA